MVDNDLQNKTDAPLMHHRNITIRHNVAEILLVAFGTFVLVMILFHLYLKRNEKQHFKRMAKRASTGFEWERDPDDEY